MDAGAVTVTETLGYNALGLPDHHAHPRAAGQPLFAVSTQYQGAYPVALYLNGLPLVHDVTYNAAGGMATFKTGLNATNDVTTTITPDVLPSRPHAISAVRNGTTLFDTGLYGYDGAANVTTIGSDSFTYDPRSRLLSASLAGSGSQSYTYDRFGNVLTKGATAYPVDAATNRLNAPYAFDARGNLTSTGTLSYSWDYFDRMTRGNEGATPYDYAYTADNERLVRAPQSGGNPIFTLRNSEKRVATELIGNSPTPTISRDNAFLGNLLVASWSNIAVSGNQWPWSFYSSDHLGTPRLLTGLAGEQQEARKYWPYGEEAGTQTTPQRLRFATMERDPEGPRYYDHARHHDTGLARFTSPDVLGGKPGDPQSWNRYTYARNNPIKYVDRDGLGNDLAYGPFSDNTPKTLPPAIPWSQMTSQQRLIESVFTGITLVAAFAPLAAAAPALADVFLATTVAHPTATATGAAIVELAATGAGVTTSGAAVENAISSLSKNSVKHIMAHVGEFQKLDPTMSFKDVVQLGLQISGKAENLVGTPGGRKVFDQVVKVGEQTVKVRAVLNVDEKLRSVHIRVNE